MGGEGRGDLLSYQILRPPTPYLNPYRPDGDNRCGGQHCNRRNWLRICPSPANPLQRPNVGRSVLTVTHTLLTL